MLNVALSQKGQEKVFDFGGKESSFNYYFTAHYLNCENEMLPVTDGYKICLVYNVIYTGVGNPPSGIDPAVQMLTNYIQLWESDNPSNFFFYYLFFIYFFSCYFFLLYILIIFFTILFYFNFLQRNVQKNWL